MVTTYPGQQGQNVQYPQWLQVGMQQQPNVTQLQEWFRKADLNNNGLLSAEELQKCMLASGNEFTIGTCKLMLEAFDYNKSGTLNFQEFMALYNYLQRMKQAYTQYDRSGAGLNIEEALEAMGAHPGMHSEMSQLIPQMFSHYDKYGTGRLKMNSFLKLAFFSAKIMNNYEMGLKPVGVRDIGQQTTTAQQPQQKTGLLGFAGKFMDQLSHKPKTKNY